MRDSFVVQLKARLLDEWLPAFCEPRRLDPTRFKMTHDLDPHIAKSVIRAVDAGLVESVGNGTFALPSGKPKAGIFWHGPRAEKPRRPLFGYEGLISVAAAAELNSLGWRREQMAFEPIRGAFDLGVFDEVPAGRLLIACEAKTKPEQIDKLVDEIQRCGRWGPHPRVRCPRQRSGHPKYEGLAKSHAELFWAVAPGYRPVYSVVSLSEGFVRLIPGDEELLRKPRRRPV